MTARVESNGRLSLAYRGLEVFPAKLGEKFGSKVFWLDLSGNKFADLRSLAPFSSLHTLVADDNFLTSRLLMPALPSLQVLWLNKNRIVSLNTFVDQLVDSAPNLEELSLMANEAAPSFFNGGSKQEHIDYRLYVISRLPRLRVLDSSPVTPEERAEAKRVFPFKGL